MQARLAANSQRSTQSAGMKGVRMRHHALLLKEFSNGLGRKLEDRHTRVGKKNHRESQL